jgi:hypothetical protein
MPAEGFLDAAKVREALLGEHGDLAVQIGRLGLGRRQDVGDRPEPGGPVMACRVNM